MLKSSGKRFSRLYMRLDTLGSLLKILQISDTVINTKALFTVATCVQKFSYTPSLQNIMRERSLMLVKLPCVI